LARSYLKSYGLITNSKRGVWSLTERGSEAATVNPEEVKRDVRAHGTIAEKFGPKTQLPGNIEALDHKDAAALEPTASEGWRETLLEVLIKLRPVQFERLSQRILRESGFVQVEVTGRSGDGGIDGTGTVELGGLLAFPVLFQCKRYQGSVGPSVVRDFRGAMVGRADRGLILTTGVFSQEARREARRDGAPPIDLVDRERLLDKLKELGLGVEVELVESVSLKPEWFESL
jgi:restriction system protein